MGWKPGAKMLNLAGDPAASKTKHPLRCELAAMRMFPLSASA
jgi:hypothetical protein